MTTTGNPRRCLVLVLRNRFTSLVDHIQAMLDLAMTSTW